MYAHANRARDYLRKIEILQLLVGDAQGWDIKEAIRCIIVLLQRKGMDPHTYSINRMSIVPYD